MARKSNAGQVLAAWLEVTTAIRRLSEIGVEDIRTELGVIDVVALEDSTAERECEAAGTAITEIAQLVFELDGKRPRNPSELHEVLSKVKRILEIKGWPAAALSYAIDVAEDDLLGDGFTKIFGDSAVPMPHPLGIPDLPRRLLIQAEGEAAREVAFADFARDNEEEPTDMIGRVRELKIGERATFGGGAAPAFWISVLE